MAITDYTTLQAAIGTWADNRSNLPAAEIVDMAERELFRELILRTEETDTSLVGVVGSRYIALPGAFLEPRAVYINITGSGRSALDPAPEEMDTSDAQGQPQFWAIDGTNLAFERPCDQAYSFTLRSVQSLTALSDANPSNWLLANHPDLYLAACELQAALWIPDDDQIGRWQPIYDRRLASVNNQAHRSRNLAPMRVDPALTRGGRGSYDIRTG